MRGGPIYLFVIRNQLLLRLLHIHKPAVFRVIQQGRGASPAERVLMRIRLGGKESIILFEIREYLLVRFFYSYLQSCEPSWHFLGKHAGFANRMVLGQAYF